MSIYVGTFLIAFSTLALEVTLSRILSVTSWYYLAFLVISTALLGMTAGAVTVYLKPDWFTGKKLNANLIKFAIGYALVVPLALILICLIPLKWSLTFMGFSAMVLTALACSIPFYFSGVVITLVLTKYHLPIGKIYASDLIGASLGCLFVLGGLEIFDAPSLIILCGAIGALAALSFAWRHSKPVYPIGSGLLVIVLSLTAVVNTSTLRGIRPLFVKGALENPDRYHLEKWNSFSRVLVYKQSLLRPQLWGPSLKAPKERTPQYYINIDGDACTRLRKFSSLDDIEHLRFDVTNIPYYLRPGGGACIIGVGGGRDIQSAIWFGHKTVTGIEVNPIFIGLLKNEFRKFAGIADKKGITLVADEARSYLSRTREKFSVIQMSMIDTWAATGAGAFTLSENALYTVEAWQVFLNRLKDDGIFTVSRWHSESNLGETGRVLSLAVATLLREGVEDPSQNIAMVTAEHISTLLFSKKPFNNVDITMLKKVCHELQFSIPILPGTRSKHRVLRKIISTKSLRELRASIANEPFNYEPTTDENPYFFNMLRLSNLDPLFNLSEDPAEGVIKGNLIAIFTLVGLILALFLLTIVTIVVPLLVKGRSMTAVGKTPGIFWVGALYFSLIGAGFMFVEIALIQRLSIFLSHPIYALGIVLFTIIASTAVGSYISEKLPLTRSPWIFVYPVVMAAVILIARMVLPMLLSGMITSPMPTKIVSAILVLFPLGLLLGFFFPTGMRLVRALNSEDTPWYWALNGIFGVLCSALAVFFSIHFGISTNFYIAAVCYSAILACIYYMYKKIQAH